MGELAGRTAIVIGGGGGIGAAVSRALVLAGARVIIGDRDAKAMTACADQLRAAGGTVDTIAVDVVSEVALDAFYRRAAELTAHANILINVAGGTIRRNFEDGSRDDGLTDIRRNFGYVIDSVRHALPLLRASAQGRSIVNFTTIEAYRGAAGFAIYAGAKAATTNFSKALAVEFAPEAIRVNCVVPDTTPSQGNIDAMLEAVRAELGKLSPEALATMLQMYIPMGAAPSAEDLAEAALFLVSDRARSITGIALHVDGGTSAAAGFVNWPFGDGFLPTRLPARLLGFSRRYRSAISIHRPVSLD